MVLYTCPTCSKEFSKKCDFINHTVKKKKPCKPNNKTNLINNDFLTENNNNLHNLTENNNNLQSITINKNTTCEYCKKSFINIYSLKRHCENFCKVKKEQDERKKTLLKLSTNNMVNIDELDIDDNTKLILSLFMNQSNFIINSMKKEIEQMNQKMEYQQQINQKLEDKITKLDKKKILPKKEEILNNKLLSNTVGTNVNSLNTTNTTNNTTNSNNTTNNTQNITNNNTINIVAHGKEDYSKIDLETIMTCLSTFHHKEIIPSITKHIFINDNKPENKNFCVVDLARNKCTYSNGKKWLAGKTNDKIIKIFDNVHNMLTEPFEQENIEKTTEFIKANPKKFNATWIRVARQYLKSLYDEEDKENMECKAKVLDELKLMFFNHRHDILKSK